MQSVITHVIRNIKHIISLAIFTLLTNISILQEIEQKFQSVLDSTYQANKDAVGIMTHIESPDKKISWISAIGFSNKNTEKEINKNQPLPPMFLMVKLEDIKRMQLNIMRLSKG